MIESTPRAEQVALAVRGRAEAHLLLDRLLIDRGQSEARLAAAGKNDPLKRVTGTSSLDRAITSTQAITERLDDLVRALQGVNEVPIGTGTGNGRPHVNGAPNGNGHARSVIIETFEVPVPSPTPCAVAAANASP